MSNPLAQKMTLPFRGRSYDCRLTLEGLFAAEMDLNMAIVSPSEKPFHERPVMVQMVCYLYAALSTVAGLNPTATECRAAMAGPKAGYISDAINSALPGLTAQLTEYAKQFRGGEESDPLEAVHGGPDNGPLLSPGMESAAPNSGN